MKVVLAGGSGSLGRRISADLSARGHQVVVLSRQPDASSAVRQVLWDGRTVGDWAAHRRRLPRPRCCGSERWRSEVTRHWG